MRVHAPMPSGHTLLGLERTGLTQDAGVYCLVLRLPRPHRITAGRLGCRRLAAGWYLYVGSAKRNLAARLRRHLRREKRFRWHIDYLRGVARVEHIWVWAWTDAGECRANARVQGLPGAAVPWTGFGSSDCRCRSHLTVFHGKPGPPQGPAPLRLSWPFDVSAVIETCYLTRGSKGRILR